VDHIFSHMPIIHPSSEPFSTLKPETRLFQFALRR
jgi:hypothetical protein